MKAINLIPADHRRGAGGAAGRTGGAAYAIVGLLAIALILFGSWTLTNKQITEKTAEASSLEQQAQIKTAQASALGSFKKFADIRANRVQTVKKLVDSRFDWAHAMGEVSRVLPARTWLTAMTGTIAPGVATDVGGPTDPLRAARPVPAIEMAGCSTSQTEITRLIARLRLINGVDRVSISSAKKATTVKPKSDTTGPIDSAALSSGKVARKEPCTQTRPTFSLVVFFRGLITPPGKTGKPELQGQQAAPAAGATPAPATNSTPTTTGTTTTPTPTTSATTAPGGTQ